MTDEQAREIAAGVLRGSAAVGRALSESSADPIVRVGGYLAAGLAEAIASALRTHPPEALIRRLQEIASEPSPTAPAAIEASDAALRAEIRSWYADQGRAAPLHPLDVRRAIPMPPRLDSERPPPVLDPAKASSDLRSDMPRRIQLAGMTPAELAIRAAAHAVEALPPDVRLTAAMNLLHEARERVADYVDGREPAPPPNPFGDDAP